MQVQAGTDVMNGNPEQATRNSAPRGRPRRQPSRRNLELYFELVCEGRRQTDVAMRFRVSQPRVAQIWRMLRAGSMKCWAKGQGRAVRPLRQKFQRSRAISLAIAIRRIQIEAAYGRDLNYFGGAKASAWLWALA